jgi:poly(A) polymerase
MDPVILQRSEHCISRKNISPNALKVLYRLHDRGYKAYLAGGCVRDLLLGRNPKDFDVVTDATPQEVKRCCGHVRLIGRRFRLAHVIFPDEVIEVATFRAASSDDDAPAEENDVPNSDSVVHEETGIVLRDNVFGSPEEDAFRRDFTVNALFYNIDDFSIIDYTGGLVDLEKHRIRSIGDPDKRYQEDPVRMIRALRFASTLHLNIEDETYAAMLRQREHLMHASHARMYEEILKFFYSGGMEHAFTTWLETGLLDVMFPGFAPWYREQAAPSEKDWHRLALRQMDKWKLGGTKPSAELAYTLFLCPWIRSIAAELHTGETSAHDALIHAVQQAQRCLADRVLIPKRGAFKIYDLLKSQERFPDRSSRERITRFLRRPYFRDALVFYKFDLLARGEKQTDLLQAWSRDLRNAPPPDTDDDEDAGRSAPRRPRRRRFRR